MKAKTRYALTSWKAYVRLVIPAEEANGHPLRGGF